MFLIWSLLATAAWAATASDLVGTWTTKSHEVITGPGFYDPLKDKLLEPNLTGISYSFDDQGHYEEAYYRAISNPADPSCPKGIMQWQHGSFEISADGSLILTPIAVDGRQLLSDPCRQAVGLYTRYNTTEHFKSFSTGVDKYHKIQRLDLKKADGSLLHPMFLAYRPPKMLPTTTLNPTPTGKGKRDLSTKSGFSLISREELINPKRWWWLGVLMTSLGGAAVFYS
ncbi:hypothetical protein PENANT_c033G07618 [Penicillium antarcticum]|uniref:Protein ROT1 n=1 Tax=Penicillium antarcticum TaxID=416450 RepID=A0A1V6PUY2_9EURO|nr:uncharacterized protein N7508_000874 [Penicillium antarcticum]KAJ5320591.1 hypothetical protein N7508_000874 [Penicillium antarcticum]OQD80775.1 hypothetical protein PENANT_c033G07618 [Penicillium antarcticum]